MNDIRKAILELIQNKLPVQTRWATVKSVDWNAKTMVVLIDGLEYFDVLLGLGDHQVKPSANSKVLVGMIGNKEAAMWLIYAEQIDEQWINGDQYGGLLISKEVKSYFDKLEQAIATGLDAVGAGTAANGATGKTAFETAMATANKNKFENKKVKHG